MPNTAPTFYNGDGKVTTPIGTGDDWGLSVALQPDGKVLVAGYTSGSDWDFALVRYNSDGSLDTSFQGGKVTTPIGTSDDYAFSVTLQPDGKILVAGRTFNGSDWDFALVRYNSDGSLDTSFDGDGKVTTPIGTSNDYAFSVTLQPDGKILVAGSTFNGSNWDFALARYNSDGSLDTSFDGDGKVTTPIGSGRDDWGQSVTLLPDGEILVAGYYSFALALYNSNGGLIGTFTTPIGEGQSVTLQPDGKILVAGYTSGDNRDFVLARYNSFGSLDTTFGSSGKVTTPIGTSDDYAYSVTLQPDGKILVAGYTLNGSHWDFALVRYNSDGSLDTSFDGDGIVTTRIGPSNDYAYSVTLQPDGKILVAGTSYNGSNYDLALVRYNSDGSLDTTFDGINTLNGTPTFIENGAPVILDSDVAIQDAELRAAGSYAGACVDSVVSCRQLVRRQEPHCDRRGNAPRAAVCALPTSERGSFSL
jgi:uncharacterized delta-60 repeat protein